MPRRPSDLRPPSVERDRTVDTFKIFALYGTTTTGYSPDAASPATTFRREHLDGPTTESSREAVTALRFLLTYSTSTLSVSRFHRTARRGRRRVQAATARVSAGGIRRLRCGARARGRERTTNERRGGGGARRRVARRRRAPAVGPTGRNGVALFAAARRRRRISREYSSLGLGHGRDDVFLMS